MAYGGRDFDLVTPDTDKVYSIDFINELQPGETIVEATPTLTLRIGTDPDPMSHAGISQVNGTVLSCRIAGLLAGCTYNYGGVVQTSFGNTKELYFGIPVQPVFD